MAEPLLTDDEIAAKQTLGGDAAFKPLYLTDDERASQENALRSSVTAGVAQDPVVAARVKALADKTGLPVDVVGAREEEVQRQQRANEVQTQLAYSPVLRRQMLDPQFAALAHDDTENLSMMEKIMRTQLGAAAHSGLLTAAGSGAKLVELLNPFTTSEEELATLYKNDSQALKLAQSSPTALLSRVSKATQEASTLAMENRNPEAKLDYDKLRYFTLDPNETALASPIKMASDLLQSLPSSVALGWSGGMAVRVASKVEQQALAAGMTAEAAKAAGVRAGSETMAKFSAASEGSVGYGQQAMQTREQADKVSDTELAKSSEYKTLITDGYTPEAARAKLSAQAAEQAGKEGGLIDAITNFFGGRILGKIFTEGGKLLPRTAKGFTTEATTEAVQSGFEQLSQNAAVKQFLDPSQELMDGVAENIAQGFVVGGLMGGGFSAMAGAKYKQERATHDAAVISELMKIARNTELRTNAPSTFAQFVNAAAEESPVDAVYVDAAVFAQSMVKAGLDAKALETALPEVSMQMPDALATQGRVRIPLGEFASTFAGTPVEQELIMHAATSFDGPTANEVHDKAFAEETKQQVEKVLAGQELRSGLRESAAKVEQELLNQLNTANRFTKDVNAVKAKLAAAMFAVQAQRFGMTPEQMFAKFKLNIRAESVAGTNVMDQPRSPTAVGYWEGPGGEHTETDTVPGAVERAKEMALNDRRWHKYTGEVGPAVIRHNKRGPIEPAVFRSGRELNQKAVDQTQTPAFKKWFGDSKVVDAEGKPLVVYHGTVYDNEGEFAPDAGISYFSPDKSFAGRWAQMRVQGRPQAAPHVLPVYLSIQKLFDFRNPAHRKLAEVWVKANAENYPHSWRTEADLRNQIKRGYFGALEDPEMSAVMLDNGFDGFIVREADNSDTFNYGVFSPTQIKSAIGNQGTFDANDPNILHQEDPFGDLLIQHNLTQENLLHAARMGGIPVPSLAIARADDSPTGFGEITLIGRKEMADPRGYARTRVFAGDLYAPRYPSVHYKLDKQALAKLNEILKPYRQEGEREVTGDTVTSLGDLTSIKAVARWAADNFKDRPEITGHASYNAAESLLNEIGAKSKIFRGFTNAGNRSYTPHTLENVVKILKKSLRGGESESNIYGMGQLRAKFAPQFKSMQGVKNARGRIVSDAAFEAAKKEVEDEFFKIKEALAPYYTASVGTVSSDTVMAVIEDAQRKGFQYAAREYGFDEIPEDVRQQVYEFVTRLRNMPTEYFEAKILREVQLSEFAAAVVPAGIQEAVLNELGNAGVAVHTYDPAGGEIGRKAKVREVATANGPQVLFQEQLPAPSEKDITPVYYSALQWQFGQVKTESAPAEQWKTIINGLVNKGGVKKEEITISGVLDWLDAATQETALPFAITNVDERNGPRSIVAEFATAGEAEQFVKKQLTPRNYRVEEVPFEQRKTNITRDEVLAYLHSDGDTEVKTTILGEDVGVDEDGEISDAAVEQRAEQLWRDNLPQEAEHYANESDYVNGFSEVMLRLPNYRVVEVEPDIFRGEKMYGLQRLDWGVETEGKDMPSDADALNELVKPRITVLSGEFTSQDEAEQFAKTHPHLLNDDELPALDESDGPYWTFTDNEGEEESGRDSESEAQRYRERVKQSAWQNEVDSYIENADYDDSGYWERQAREELEDERDSPRSARRNNGVIPVRHAGSYQTKGGKDYRELVLWVPGIEPEFADDSTHFGDVARGTTVGWIRGKVHDGEDGKPIFFIDEFQSQRAQEGREHGFIGDKVKQYEVRSPDETTHGIYNTREEAEKLVAGNPSKNLKVVVNEATLTKGIAPAPFVKSTQAWVSLLMKRAIRYAIDHDIDRIAWTTGAQQIGFYTGALRSQIRELKWKKTQDGIEIEADGRNVNRTFSDKELRVAAGGAITDQIVNSPEQSGTISGENIRFEATWPSAMYGNESGRAPITVADVADNRKANEAARAKGKPEKALPADKPSIITAETEKIIRDLGSTEGVRAVPVASISSGPGYKGPQVLPSEVKALTKIAEAYPTSVRAVVRMMEEDGLSVKAAIEAIAPHNYSAAQAIAEGLGGSLVANIGARQPGFTITPAMEEKALAGFRLFQKDATGNRGQISFEPGAATITLLANADLSTFVHELGHFYLEMLHGMATMEGAPPEIKQDMAQILNWFGMGDGNEALARWGAMTLNEKRPYHEQFAKGFETYLFEGNAPSIELKGAFARVRAWMLNVYRQLMPLVKLTPEVRGVFDRMLATNQEIIAAETARGYAPLFESAEKMGASHAEWRQYQETGQTATQDAVDSLQTRSLRDMQWLSNAKAAATKRLHQLGAQKRKAVHAEIAAQVNAEPIYQAMRWLKSGEQTTAEGEEIKATAGFKLDAQALAAMYPAGELAANHPDLSKLGTGRYGMVASEGGLHPDLVAEMFGFGSGDELVRKLAEVEPARSVIEGKTDQAMLERYGDLTDEASIAKAADKEIHNEARAKFIATELNALARATGQKRMLTNAARDFAAAIVARKKLRDVKPAQYEHAEARAAKAAEKAFGAGKLVEAATEKRNQLVNNFAAKAAFGAQAEIEKGVAYLRRVADSKSVDPAYREQIQAILERFDLRQTSIRDARRRTSLLEWMEQQKENDLEPVIDPDIANEALRQPYQELTVEQFRGLVDSVKNIEHLGRLKHKLLKLADQREFKAAVDEAVGEIDLNAKKSIPQQLEHNTWLAKMKSGTAEFFAMHKKFAQMWREMDGFKDGGKLWSLFVRPMNESGDTENNMRERATLDLQAIFKPLLDQGGLRKKTFIPAINASLSREGRIMVALNTGNDGNLQRLMDGDHWTKAQVDAVVDTLTKSEMDFVQAVWDYIGSYRKQIGDQQKRLTGVEPEWVEPRKVVTQHGVYRGGYLPAKYDTTRSIRAQADEATAGIMDQWRGARGLAKTRDSFTKERASKVVDRPLRKDFGVVTQHITEVIHRLSWQEYLADANRLLRSKGITNAIVDHYGMEVHQALRNTLEDIAAGERGAQNVFERVVNYMRIGATIVGLGWRMTTALLQPIGLTQSMVRIGPKYIAKGLAEFIGDAARMENTAKRIYAKSDFMRLRGKTLQREISEIQNQISGKNSAIQASYFYLIQKLQLVADIPTWLGQYHKAIEGGADENTSIAQADQAVIDAQGAGTIKDLAGIQRGSPLLKLFTNFYSFFSTTYNLTGEAVGRTDFKNPLSIGRLMVDLLLLYMIPAALGTLMKAALHSGDDDQDEDKLIRQLIADQMTYLLGTVVGLREVGGGVQTMLGLPGDYQGPASMRLFAAVAKTGKQLGQGDVDEAMLKAINETGGLLFHYPAGQINATMDGIVTMASGKTDNPGALIVGSNKK